MDITETVTQSVVDRSPTKSTNQCNDDGNIKNAGEAEMSKRQKKRLLKHQKWLARKEEMRKARSAERKMSKIKKAKTGERPAKIYKMADKEASQVKVVIDCDFDDLMTEKDIRQLVKQIQRSYAENRRSPTPLQFYLCSVSGKTMKKLDDCASGYQNWDVYVKSEKPVEVFDKESIVYLTSDSPNILDTLESDKAYIIGGLVDHNHYKGLCYQRAIDAGVAHAQLPIGDYVKLKTRNVMTVNHVFEILVKYIQCKDWKQAFYHVIPQRKRAIDEDENDNDDEHDKSITKSAKSLKDENDDTKELEKDNTQESNEVLGNNSNVTVSNVQCNEISGDECTNKDIKLIEDKDNKLDPDNDETLNTEQEVKVGSQEVNN